MRHATLLVKSAQPLGEVIQRVEATAKEGDPTLPIQYSRALQTSIDRSQSDRRLFAWVLSMLGWLAFVLAAVGLYGLLAQSVVERTREFGIRMAIGSERGRIFTLVLRQALWIGALGTALGSGLAFLGSRLIEAQLYGVTRLDPAVYAAAAAAALATTSAITTGDNPTLGRASAMMATRGRSDAAPETTGKDRTRRDESAITIPAGLAATATRANAIPRFAMHSQAMFTCHADAIANWFRTAIANTPCAAPNPGRSRPLVHSE